MVDDLNICKICNKVFETTYAKNKHLQTHKISYKDYVIKFYYNGIEPVCKCGCGKKMPFRRESGKWFRDYALNHGPKLHYTKEYIDNWKNKCKKTSLKKYGTPYYTNREKAKKTSLEKYGNEYYNNPEKIKHSLSLVDKDTIIKKMMQTNLIRYGNKYFTNREKSKQTLLKNYGVSAPSKNKQIVQKIVKSRYQSFLNSESFINRLDSIGVIPLFKSNEYFGVKKQKYKFECKICHNIFYDDIDNCRLPRCLMCNPYQKSNMETEVFKYIKSLNIAGVIYQKNKEILNGKELDIYIPDKKIAIELDGLIWHSEMFGKKDKNYHLNKTLECEKNGIRLIHIFEDEWLYKKDIVMNRLNHILNLNDKEKIYARKCEIKEITSKEKNLFLEKYHIQGKDNSKIKIGALYGGELISVMSFGGQRRALGNTSPRCNEYEIIRFASKKHVVGIASRLLKFFIENYRPEKIISYADRRWSNGNLYSKLGFKKISDGSPNYWYIDTNQYRYHRFGFRKNILHKKLKIFNPKLTEWENMQLNGYDRIWDCGSIKYEMIINKN